MRKSAAYKGLFLIAVAILLLGGTHSLMACNKTASPATDGVKKVAADSGSLSNTACEKHAKETEETETVEVKPVSPELPEPVPVPSSPEPNQKQPVKNDVANGNMSFNFLYYLFYKFSVSEFFKTPDFSGSTGY